MKQFFKILLACLSAILLFCFIIFIVFAGLASGLSSGTEEKEIEQNSVLYFDLSDQIEDQGKDNNFLAFNSTQSPTIGLNQIIRSIENAKTDDKIKGIYIKTGICNNGWASLKEIKDALIDFKSSKKFILSYGEIADQKSYYIASIADKIFLNPSGAFEFIGLSITGTFYKGALDKLGVTSEAFHCGKYKGAYEPYKLDKFSEPNRYQLNILLSDFYAEFLQTVSKRTSMDTSLLLKMANEGAIKFPADALENKFIDGLVFSDSVERIMKTKLKLEDKDKINFVSFDEYADNISTSTKVKDKIAVLYASGEIHDGEGLEDIYSKTMTATIRKIAKDETIKAVVLRINSPGGSALASEIIYHELMQLKKKKPIVVSMSNYAASGGYYMACAGDSIFAENTSIVGSIGVLGVMFNIDNMMKDKLGVTFDNIKTGPFADFPNVTRPMTEPERNWIQGYLDSTYRLFKTRVADARKMDMAKVEELAQGHVYSGKLALDLNLIDAVGNQKRAIQSAAKMSGLKEYRLVEYPKPGDKIDELIATLTGTKREETVAKKILGEDYKIYKEIQKVRDQTNKIQAILPISIDIR